MYDTVYNIFIYLLCNCLCHFIIIKSNICFVFHYIPSVLFIQGTICHISLSMEFMCTSSCNSF